MLVRLNRQITGNAPIPSGSGSAGYVIVTSSGSYATLGDLYQDVGINGAPLIKVQDLTSFAIYTTSVLAGPSLTIDVDRVYTWTGTTWEPTSYTPEAYLAFVAASASSAAETVNQGAAGTDPWPVSIPGTVTATVSGTVTANQGTNPWVTDVSQIAGAAPSLSNALPVELADGAGNALGTSSHPVRTDPTGTTTQPVSGSVTVSGTATVTQGTAAAIAGAWPVTITDLTNILGTVSHPIRIDPTGSTLQPVNLSQVSGATPSLSNPLPVELGDGAGNALGTSGHPLRTDPTGTTTQPVSGTVSATQGTSPWVTNLTQIAGSAPSLSNALPVELSDGAGNAYGTSGYPVRVDPTGTTTQPVSGSVTVSGTATVTQGTAASLSGAWPVEITEGTNVLGTSSHPIRTDPTGTTAQPITQTGTVLSANSSSTPLAGSASFTGTGTDVTGYGSIAVVVFTDQVGTLNVEFSTNNTNWDTIIPYSIAANTASHAVIGPAAQFFRIVYTNGSSAQSVFRLQTIGRPVTQFAPTVPISSTLDPAGDALVVKASISGKTTGGGGSYVDVKVSPSGAVQVGGAVDQGAAAALASAWPVEVTDGTNVLGTSAHPVRTDPTGTTSQPTTRTDGAGHTAPAMDAASRAGYFQMTDGTHTMPTGDAAARPVFVELSDGSAQQGTTSNPLNTQVADISNSAVVSGNTTITAGPGNGIGDGIVTVVGSLTATLTWSLSWDGINYFQVGGRLINSTSLVAGSGVSNPSTNAYRVPMYGARYLKATVSSYSAGTPTISVYLSTASSGVSLLEGMPSSTGQMGQVTLATGNGTSLAGISVGGNNSLSTEQASRTRQTYTFGCKGIVPDPAGATDIVVLTGSATKVVKVTAIRLSGVASSAVGGNVLILRRSTADTDNTTVGTSVTASAHDPNNAGATCSLKQYSGSTSAPTVGTAVGVAIRCDKYLYPVSGTGAPSVLNYTFGTNDQEPTLRSNGQYLAINLDGVVLSSGSVDVTVTVTEE